MEILYDTHYDYSSYLVTKETNGSIITVHITDTFSDSCKPLKPIRYKNIGSEYKSPFLSWYNAIFCSNAYGPAPDYAYMNHAVQNDMKTAATLYFEANSQEGLHILMNLPADCAATSYGDTMTYVHHRGKLSSYFDSCIIQDYYRRHGVYNVDWQIVKNYFEIPLSEFGDEKKCGFSLQSGGDQNQTIIKGLVLGYPIESTVEFLPHFKY